MAQAVLGFGGGEVGELRVVPDLVDAPATTSARRVPERAEILRVGRVASGLGKDDAREALGDRAVRDVDRGMGTHGADGGDGRISLEDAMDIGRGDRHPSGHGQRSLSARATRSAESGSSVTWAPDASRTAAAIVAGTGMIGGSPSPFAPNGPAPRNPSTNVTSGGGTSPSVGIR